MNQGYLYLAIENLKRIFYKKTILIFAVALAFIIGYVLTLFFVQEAELEVEFSSNDFLIYFFNDFIISGILIKLLFIIFLSGMFKDNINYMYISRLRNKAEVLKMWLLSIFVVSLVFLIILTLIVIILGSIIGDFDSNWSVSAVNIFQKSINMKLAMDVLSPTSTILVSVWLQSIGIFVTGLVFLIGYLLARSFIGGLALNGILLLLDSVIYLFNINWLYKISPNINTIFYSYFSINNEFVSISYYVIYILAFIGILGIISSVALKKYIEESM